MKYLIITLMIFCSAFCSAGENSTPINKEIRHLLAQLEHSGCKFNRNGSWYSGSEASDHLRNKYDYLLRKNPQITAEFFIVKAASESSLSGKPYQVQCAGKPVVISSIWFNNELNSYRKLKSH
ncbi:MAG: DUF5329 domain-containing protein [Arenimonas sp.]|nr:DUF5329 domain-containing protein [Arenimonas sp.]